MTEFFGTVERMRRDDDGAWVGCLGVLIAMVVMLLVLATIWIIFN